MEAIVLSFRGEPLRVFPLDTRPLEVGSGAGCDIVVHDASVPEHLLLVRRDGMNVRAHRLDQDGVAPVDMTPERAIEVGEHHTIMRVLDAVTGERTALNRTEPVVLAGDEPSRLSLLVVGGTEARRVPLHARPITIGANRGLDLTLLDRAVSGRHARIEPSDEGYLIRDLGSRNGTYVDGVPAILARIGPGSRIRVGRTELRVVVRGERGDARADGIVAVSPAMIEVLEMVERCAKLSWPALIVGETGVGKEGVARAIHLRSARRERPFVTINAAGFSDSMVESQLFGHEKGAFTGAAAQHRGVFEQADGGTLFLDEIGELPLSMQARLLRVLETWEIRRVGSESTVLVNVRLVCATHRDLPALVESGGFREDLYYRLARLPIRIAPLRERPDDVVPLAEHFLARAQSEVGARSFTEAALSRLRAHAWPGNARELRNVVEGAAAFSAGVIDVHDIESTIARTPGARERPNGSLPGLDMVLRKHAQNQTAAAKELGVPRSTLRDRLERAKRKAGAKG